MRQVLSDLGDVLLLRISGDRIRGLGWKHFALGLVLTWIVGIGRWYDDPDAVLAQQLGAGSVGYIFVISLLICWLGGPFATAREIPWTYPRVLTYVSLTALPGIVYAFPIEWVASASVSRYYNLSALALVSAWRVAMLVRLYRDGAGMKPTQTAATTLFLISGIVLVLSFARVLNAVASAMGGFREEGERLAADLAVGACMISIGVLVVSGISYWYLCATRYRGWPWTGRSRRL
ncbi:MAG: hypothetical protein ACR2HJ_06100 [Fimbriimonadales bacterium]